MPPFVIGIGGGSASGKSALTEQLREQFRPLPVQVISQDSYFHEPDRLPRHQSREGARAWPDHNHPESFDFPALCRCLRQAREGSADVVILEGILALYDPALRSLMDLKLFIDADPDERILRRIRRNLARGCDLDDVCDFYLDSVRYRHREFCQPTRAHADLVIPGGRDDAREAARLLAEVCRRVRTHLSRGAHPRPTTGREHGHAEHLR